MSSSSARRGVQILKPGDTVGDRYRILGELGRGGIGVVYRASDETTAQPVVIKVLLSQGTDGYLSHKFADEKRALLRVRHPGVVGIVDSGELEDGVPFLVLEFVDGVTMRQALREDAYALPVLGAMFGQVGAALHQAHLCGVIHRDLKPENVMVVAASDKGTPRVRIIDFGLATVRDPDDQGSALTQVAGTVPYMAYEQFWGKPSRASDIYAMAVMAYEAITGRRPFVAQNPLEMVNLQMTPPTPPSALRPELPEGLDTLLMAALSYRQDDRPHTARLCGDTLAALLDARGVASQTSTVILSAPAPEFEWTPEGGELPPHPQAPAKGATALQIVADAFTALRDKQFAKAHALLDEAAARPDAPGRNIRGAIAQCRGTAWFHEGRVDAAIGELTRALDLLGPEHYATGRVLDALAMAFAGHGYFQGALALFDKALALKRLHNDEEGLALSEGQLGRLHFELGNFEEAESHFRQDLEISRRLGDVRSVAQMHGFLGRVAVARQEWEAAAGLLDEAIGESARGGYRIVEAFARKDRALAHLGLDQAREAAAQLERARVLFQGATFKEGLVHVDVAQARLDALAGRFEEAERALTTSAQYFVSTSELAEAARTLAEQARLRRRQGGSVAAAGAQAYLEALRLAQDSRHERLLWSLEDELKTIDPAGFREYRRLAARWLGLPERGRAEWTALSVRFRGLQGAAAESVEAFREVLLELRPNVRRHNGVILSFDANGLTAVFENASHAADGVRCALEIDRVLRRFSVPRRLVGLPPLEAGVGVGTGDMHLAEVGRGVVIAIGPAVVLADRLADAGTGVRVAEETRLKASDDALFNARESVSVEIGGKPYEAWELS
jgi:tetratricopeptide (TPR) repeat protein